MPTDLTGLLRDHAKFVEARCPDGETVAVDMRAAADAVDDLLEIKRFASHAGFLAAQQEHNRMMAEKDAEIERLQKLLEAAIRLHENRDRIAWGVDPDGDGYGYYLGLKWAGKTMLDVIEAEAAEAAKEE